MLLLIIPNLQTQEAISGRFIWFLIEILDQKVIAYEYIAITTVQGLNHCEKLTYGSNMFASQFAMLISLEKFWKSS